MVGLCYIGKETVERELDATEQEILDGFAKALAPPPIVIDPRLKTAKELRELLGLSKDGVRTRIQESLENGQMGKAEALRISASGRRIMVPVYYVIGAVKEVAQALGEIPGDAEDWDRIVQEPYG